MLQGPREDSSGSQEMRSASLQPLIGKAAANGGTPKATRLKPSRPPPPPPTAVELEGATVSPSSAASCSVSLQPVWMILRVKPCLSLLLWQTGPRELLWAIHDPCGFLGRTKKRVGLKDINAETHMPDDSYCLILTVPC